MVAAALLALVPRTSRLVWRTALPNTYSAWVYDAPTLADGRLFCALSGPGKTSGLEALDARTGAALWRLIEFQDDFVRLAAGGGRLVVTLGDRAWEVDPRDGRRRWALPAPVAGVGPFLSGDFLVVETARERIEAFDLRTHRAGWRVERSVSAAGRFWNRAACVAGKALWVWTADDHLRGIDLATGRVRFDRTIPAGERPRLTPMGDAALVDGEGPVQCWRASDGATRWTAAPRTMGGMTYVPAADELWRVGLRDGLLRRFRASTGEPVGVPKRAAGSDAGRIEIVPMARGGLVESSRGSVLFDARGRWRTDLPGLGLIGNAVEADGDLVLRWEGEVRRIRLATLPSPSERPRSRRDQDGDGDGRFQRGNWDATKESRAAMGLAGGHSS